MESISLRNNTKRVYTLPARIGPDGEKFGGPGAALKPKATSVVPGWYLAAIMEERCLALPFAEKKLNALLPDGEVMSIRMTDMPPKKVRSPKFSAPEPETKFSAAPASAEQLAALHDQLATSNARAAELERRLLALEATLTAPAEKKADAKVDEKKKG